MSYRVVDPYAVDTQGHPKREADIRQLSEPGGLETTSINQFKADPGDQLPLAYHVHEQQQEAFYIIEGCLQFETPDGHYQVSAGELFVVDAGSPHRAENPADADGPAVALAIGAPPVDDVSPYQPDDE